MCIDAAACATGQPASMRWQSRSRPSGVSGALRCIGASVASGCLWQIHTRSGGFTHWWTLSARSVGTTASAPSERVRLGEDLVDEGLEMLERLGVVVGVERELVPLVGEAGGEVEPGLAAVLLPGVGVAAEVLVVVTALEVLVGEDHRVDLLAHVRLQDLGADRRMVGHGDRLADVVAERGDDDLGVGAC